MKRKNILIALSLLFSLFVYLFYRTEDTVITKLFISIISQNSFTHLKQCLTNNIPLNPYIIYSLPEGLWIFTITLASKKLFIKLKDIEISLIYLPLIFAIGLEIMQLFHITNGRFDYWDIVFSTVFWLLAKYLVNWQLEKQHIFKPFNIRSFICVVCYSIVYLAHVWE